MDLGRKYVSEISFPMFEALMDVVVPEQGVDTALRG